MPFLDFSHTLLFFPLIHSPEPTKAPFLNHLRICSFFGSFWMSLLTALLPRLALRHVLQGISAQPLFSLFNLQKVPIGQPYFSIAVGGHSWTTGPSRFALLPFLFDRPTKLSPPAPHSHSPQTLLKSAG